MKIILLLHMIALSIFITGCGGDGGGGGGGSSLNGKAVHKSEGPAKIDNKTNKNCRTSDDEGKNSSNFKLYNNLHSLLLAIHFDFHGRITHPEELDIKGDFCVGTGINNQLILTTKSNDKIHINFPSYTQYNPSETYMNPEIRALYTYIYNEQGYDIANHKRNVHKEWRQWSERISNLDKVNKENPSNENKLALDKAENEYREWSQLKLIPLQNEEADLFRILTSYTPKESAKYLDCIKSELVQHDETGGSEIVISKENGENLYDIKITPSQVGIFSLSLKLKADLLNPSCILSKEYDKNNGSFKGKVNPNGYIYEGTDIPVIQSNNYEIKTEKIQKIDIKLIVTP